MHSTERDADFGLQLLALARRSIAYGLQHGKRQPMSNGVLSEALAVPRACFVTLTKAGELRGCIGTLAADKPLGDAVIDYAYCAAFEDYRFSPLLADELDPVEIEISILSAMESLTVSSEAELMALLHPGEDGLLLDGGGRHRATFLPQVWDALPEPQAFIRQLKRKAGLGADDWSDQLSWSRYSVCSYKES
jgi:hypothetical protein